MLARARVCLCECVWSGGGTVPGLDAVLDEAVNCEEGDVPDDVAPEQAVEPHIHPGHAVAPIEGPGTRERGLMVADLWT